MMEDIGLFKQGWKWLQSKKQFYSVARTVATFLRDKIGIFRERHWPVVCCVCARLGRVLHFLLIHWKDCFVRGFWSFFGLGSATLLFIMWSCFISLTSMSCLVHALLSMGIAVVAVQYLGYTPGLSIVGLCGILVLWMYANFWITGTLFIVGGYLFSLNHARLVVLTATIYAIYSVKVQVGWLGVVVSISLSFLSNDLLNNVLQWCDNLRESTQFEEQKESVSFGDDDFVKDCDYSVPTNEDEKVHSCESSSTKSSPIKNAATSTVVKKQNESSADSVEKKAVNNSSDEMKRILGSVDHYEALELSRANKIDAVLLKKEYRKKAMLVHPDKNMGSPLASESFKKLQCAYEVLSDTTKKRDYDEQLRKEEFKSVAQKSSNTPRRSRSDYCSEESRRIHCTKCGNSHVWVCTNKTKTKARWCQDCCNIIKLRMEMDGLNTEVHWFSINLKRWRFPGHLFVLKARFLMYQNGLFVREWLVGLILIVQVFM